MPTTIKELELAKKKAFPNGINTTLQQFQLAQLEAYYRTLRKIDNAKTSISLTVRERHAVLLERYAKLVNQPDKDYSLQRVKKQLQVLVVEAKKLNLQVAKEVEKSVKDIGRVDRMGVIQEYDEFALGLDPDNARQFFDADGEYQKNLISSAGRVRLAERGMNEVIEQGAKQANKILSEVALTGEGRPNAVGEIKDALALNDAQARRLVRTELIASANRASYDEYKAHGTEKISWSSAFDSNTCPICTRLNGRVWDIDSPYRKIPPAHPNCVIGDTEIIAPDLKKCYKSVFKGPACRVFFEGGDITVTANHMFLTPQGFSKASSLVKGDAIFNCLNAQGVASVGADYNRKPILAEKIFNSLLVSGEVSAVKMPSSPEDFYGDGAFIQNDIDIIRSDRFLYCESHRESFEELTKKNFIVPNGMENLFSRFSSFTSLFKGMLSAFDGHMSFRSEGKFFRSRKSCHSKDIRFASITGLDSVFEKAVSDYTSANSEPFTDGKFAFSSNIGVKNVLKVERIHINAPVYTFETDSSLYISNGILSSNCRCAVLPVPTDELLRTEDFEQGINQEGEKLTGQKWLETKDHEFVKDNLGSEYKAELFEKGVPLQNIVTSTGRIKTDLQLRQKYGDFTPEQFKAIKKEFGVKVGAKKPELKPTNPKKTLTEIKETDKKAIKRKPKKKKIKTIEKVIAPKTRKEAEAHYFAQTGNKINLKDFTDEQSVDIATELVDLQGKYLTWLDDSNPVEMKKLRLGVVAQAGTQEGKISCSNTFFVDNGKALKQAYKEDRTADVLANEFFRAKKGQETRGIISHEFGHTVWQESRIQRQIVDDKNFTSEQRFLLDDALEEVRKIKRDYLSGFRKNTRNVQKGKITSSEHSIYEADNFISKYANDSVGEFVSESLAEFRHGTNVSPSAIKVEKWLDKYYNSKDGLLKFSVEERIKRK